MYFDVVVISGLLVIGLLIAFFVGVYYFIRKDIREHSDR